METVTTLEIPTDILDSARLSVDEAKLELAIALYAQNRLALGKARKLAGLSLWEFRHQLAARRIAPHYDVMDLQDDVATLRHLGLI